MPNKLPDQLIACCAELGTDARKVLDKEVLAEEDIHDLRVFTKKTRAVCQMLRIPGWAKLNGGLKKASGLMASRRDEDVMGAYFELYLPQFAPKRTGGDGYQVSQKDRKLVDAAFRKYVEAVMSVDRGDKLVSQVIRRCRKTYMMARDAAKQVAKSNAVEASHEWRKISKCLLYQLQVLSECTDVVDMKKWAQIRYLGRLLGERNDLAVFLGRLDELPEGKIVEEARHAVYNRIGQIRKESRKLGVLIYSSRPEKFLRHP